MSAETIVLVVGFGLSGAGAVNELALSLPPTAKLIIVSASESAYYPIASLRGAVGGPGSPEQQVTISLDYFFPADSRHRILKGYNVVSLSSNEATLDREDPALGLTIHFDYAVLAMGSSYPFPCRPHPDKSSTVNSAFELLHLQGDIANSNSIIIAGGGAVGMELAGEIKYRYGKSKQVTLVHSGSRFMEEPGFKESLGKSLASQLKHMGVRVIFNHRLDFGDLKTGKVPPGRQTFDLGQKEGTVDADFLFVAFGNSPSTKLMNTFRPDLLTDAHRIRVKPTFQLNPPDGSSELDHIFAIGDISDVAETKAWVNAEKHGAVVAANIRSLIKGELATKNYTPGPPLLVVSLGANGGAGQIYYGVVVGAFATSIAKSKTLFISKFRALYHHA